MSEPLPAEVAKPWWSRLKSLLRIEKDTPPVSPPAHPASRLVAEPADLEVPDAIVDLCVEFNSRGHTLVLVGGSVRDLLLGRLASSDWDLGTSANVYEVSRICSGAVFEDTSHTEFTLAFVTHEGMRLEITPFRERHNYQWRFGPEDGALGSAGTLAQDLGGRDFTINSIAYDPRLKILYDPFGGRDDLRDRCVRALPDAPARFQFDPVRILRGLRISAKLGFEIEPDTLAAMKIVPEEERLDPRRVLLELVRLLTGPRPSAMLRQLRDMGHLAWVCPDLSAVAAVPDPLGPERTVLDRLGQVLERLSPVQPYEVLCALVAACIVREIPADTWHAQDERHVLALQVAYDREMKRFLAPLEVDEIGSNAVWYRAVFGCTKVAFESYIRECEGMESAWSPASTDGWPRLADAWWSARAEDSALFTP